MISLLVLWVPGLMMLLKVKLKGDVVVPVNSPVAVIVLPEGLQLAVRAALVQLE